MVMGELPIETEVLVIGGGPGGYAAAFRAADLGLDVTLVSDEAQLGGTCLLRGCIPSKLLLELVGLRYAALQAAQSGLHFAEPEWDLPAVREKLSTVIGTLTEGLDSLCRHRGIQRLQGRARFVAADRVHVEGDGTSTVVFRHAIIATGSRPRNVTGAETGPDSLVMDSTAALALQAVPERLLVIGGGYVGLELGLVYAGLGSQVTVAHSHERLLPQADADLVGILTKQLTPRFETIRYETRAREIHEVDNGVNVALSGPDGDEEVRFDRVLMAVGRQPNSDELSLETAGIECDEHGMIVTDRQCRTNIGNIFAVGDVAGGIQLAHKAMYEGKIAAEVIAGQAAERDARAVPAVVYTEPQLAWCGLTEQQADEGITAIQYPWRANGRALTLDAAEGMTKLLQEKASGRIVGMGVVGPHAENLLSEGTLAIELGAVAEDLSLTIHPHPTLSETVAEAAELYQGLAIHLRR